MTKDWNYWTKSFLRLLLPTIAMRYTRFSRAQHSAPRSCPILPTTR